jgi:hypothetical protein
MNRNNRRAMRKDPNAFYEGPAEGVMSDADYMAKVQFNRTLGADNVLPTAPRTGTGTGMSSVFGGLEGPGVNSPVSNPLVKPNPIQQPLYRPGSGSGSGMYNVSDEFEMGGVSGLHKFFGGGINDEPDGFDPNIDTGVNQGAMGPCEEKDVMDPNSPCYNPNYNSGTIAPQDFSVTYDINKARTLNNDGILNSKQLAGSAITSGSRTFENIYNDDYLNARTSAGNREPVNQLDYRGGFSGLNQRIMSKGQGAGSTGFNSVVGNAAFVKRGGQLGYQKGGEYDLTQEEIGRILAAGGQIEFI